MKSAKIFMLAIFMLGLSACDAKVKQCNDLIAVMNQAQELSTKATKANRANPDPKDFIAIADDVDKFKDKIGAVKLKDEKLKAYAKQYQDLFGGLSKIYREMAKATEAKDRAAIDKQIKEMQDLKFVEKVNGLNDEVNKYCGAK